MKSILVPLDGSPLSEAVLLHVKEMASGLSAGIHLLRVVSAAQQLASQSFSGPGGMDAITAPDMEAFEESVRLQRREAGDYLESQSEKLKASGFDVAWSVREGTTADEILRHIQENQFDLIAISTHGRSGLGRMVLGSVFDKVMRESGIPVLVIKPTE